MRLSTVHHVFLPRLSDFRFFCIFTGLLCNDEYNFYLTYIPSPTLDKIVCKVSMSVFIHMFLRSKGDLILKESELKNK